MAEGINGKVFLLLAGSFVCTAFGGLQSIGVSEWIQPVFLMQFLHHVKILDRKPLSIALLLLATLLTQTLGYTVAYAGEFNDPGYTVIGVLTTFAVSLLAWVILLFVFLTDLKYKKKFPDAISSHPFAFACVWTLMWHCESSFSPIGTTGNPSYSQHSIQPIVLVVAVWGLDGVVFFMALTAALLHQRLLLRQEGGESSWIVTTPWGETSQSAFQGAQQNGNLDDGLRGNSGEIQEGDSHPLLSQRRPKRTRIFVYKVRQHDQVSRLWCAILILSLLYAGGRVALFSGTFYQRGITETIKPTVGVSCILRQPKDLPEGHDDSSEFLWNATSERARAGDAFIVWSEEASVVRGKEGEDKLLSKAREIVISEHERRQSLNGTGLQSEGPYLGLSYAMLTGQGVSSYNVFTLLAPDGSVGFRYEKSHPVPFVEEETIPGPGSLEAVDTPYGRVSAAICFDFQFPRLFEQAAYLGADIVLQPSWTWGPIARTQTKADAFRAVEEGFTLVRCSSGGQSAVVTPFNEVVDLRESIETSVVNMQLPLASRLWTLYPYGGFLFGILVATVAAKYLFMAWLPLSFVLGVSNIFPEAVNLFFAGPSYDEKMIKWATQRNITYRAASMRRPLLPE